MFQTGRLVGCHINISNIFFLQDLANHPLTIYRQLVSRSDSEPSLGSFTVDASLGRQTEFGVYVEDDEDHQIKSVEFTDADGTTYGPFTKMSSTYDVVNFKTINFNVGEEPPFDDVSITVIFQ